MDYDEITYEVDEGIATITLDRPDRLNAFTVAMMRQLLDALDRVDADDAVRVVIFTGAGRGFCAGADLAAGGSSFDHSASPPSDDGAATGGGGGSARVLRDGGGLVSLRLFECTKPVIAAINGPAVGVGVTMTLPMDIRLAAESARFGFVFAGRGIVPEAASSWFLPRVVGISRAMEWVATARVFDAAEALDGGLVRAVHPDAELLARARELGREIARHAAPVSVALARQMMWRMLGADHPMEAHKLDSRAMSFIGRSADAAEGVTAFLEKRRPEWTMAPSRDMPDWYPWWTPREFS